MKTIRHFILVVLLNGLVAVTACNQEKSDTDIINNPASTKPLSAEDSARMPIIAFDTLTHNFGEMNEGDVVEYDFKFTNKGKSSLLISDVSASCGCTTPYFPKNIIKPGEGDAVKVKFNSEGKPGQFHKKVTVKANTYPNTTKLNITGVVKPKE